MRVDYALCSSQNAGSCNGFRSLLSVEFEILCTSLLQLSLFISFLTIAMQSCQEWAELHLSSVLRRADFPIQPELQYICADPGPFWRFSATQFPYSPTIWLFPAIRLPIVSFTLKSHLLIAVRALFHFQTTHLTLTSALHESIYSILEVFISHATCTLPSRRMDISGTFPGVWFFRRIQSAKRTTIFFQTTLRG